MRPFIAGPIAAAAMVLTVTLPALAQSITVSLVPSAVTFTLSNGSSSNPGNAAVVVSTTWLLLSAGRTISLYGYFSDAAAALAHTSPANTYNIPSSRVEVSVNAGANGPFDQTVPFGGAAAGRLLFSVLVTGLITSGARADSLGFNINLNGYTLPADTYGGTFRVRARVTP